jgi:hypothetical protein
MNRIKEMPLSAETFQSLVEDVSKDTEISEILPDTQ